MRRPEPRRTRLQCRRSKRINLISPRLSVQMFVSGFYGDLKECNELAGRLANEVTKSLASGEQPDYFSVKEANRILGFWKSVHGYTAKRLAAAKR